MDGLVLVQDFGQEAVCVGFADDLVVIEDDTRNELEARGNEALGMIYD